MIDALAGYEETEFSDEQKADQGNAPDMPSISAAPEVGSLGVLEALALKEASNVLGLGENHSAEEMHAPLQGPLLPTQKWGGLEQAYGSYKSIQQCHISDEAFELQRHRFQREGKAEDPSQFTLARGVGSTKVVVPAEVSAREVQASRASLANNKYYLDRTKQSLESSQGMSRREKRQRRIQGGSAAEEGYLGPWAPTQEEEERKAFWMAEAAQHRCEEEEEGVPTTIVDNKTENKDEEAVDVKIKKSKVTTIFHGRSEFDYQGRSWIEAPSNLKGKVDDQVNYLPKKLIHTYVGHTMGVQCVRFFPNSGHFILSGGMDGQAKIWDCHNQRKCMRSYIGHAAAIRDAQFADDGRKFYTCSYDKTIVLWDTETGKIIGTYTNDKTPYCITVHPDRGMDHVFIIGSQDKKAVQFDAKTGEITQEYNEHLAPVNTVTFCENGNRIVTTADDKKIFIWEFGIPVVVKHIAEPYMHSMPAVRLHPSQKFIACQSMNNQIVVYEAAGRYRFQSSKRFNGHGNTGYAILPGFSPDGRYILSGDTSGKVWFWDWKTTRNHRTLQAHDQVCMGSEWHPTAVSRVATCGWDGLVKLWE